MVAGAVICGAMFGDKLSPLSDTTNLAPAVAGAKHNDHVRSMLWTTLPTFVISLVLFVILGSVRPPVVMKRETLLSTRRHFRRI